jgi:hypothetical protein
MAKKKAKGPRPCEDRHTRAEFPILNDRGERVTGYTDTMTVFLHLPGTEADYRDDPMVQAMLAYRREHGSWARAEVVFFEPGEV